LREEKLLRVTEVAQRLGLQVSTIRRWLLLHRIEAVHIGDRAVRIKESEVDRIILQGTVPARGVRQ
jgi:excisionase family DNA binding protein